MLQREGNHKPSVYFMLLSHSDRKASLVFPLRSFEEGLSGGCVYPQAGIDLVDAYRSHLLRSVHG